MIKIERPNWLRIIFDCPSTLNLIEIPNFDLAVSWGCCQMSSQWMKSYIRNPISVTFSCKNLFSFRQCPNAPSSIIRSSGQKWFIMMDQTPWNSLVMSFDCFYLLNLSIQNRLNLFILIWIKYIFRNLTLLRIFFILSSLFWIYRILINIFILGININSIFLFQSINFFNHNLVLVL